MAAVGDARLIPSVAEVLDAWDGESELRLQEMKLKAIPEEVLELERPITKLNLAINSLSSVPAEFFKKQNKITSLAMPGNQFGSREDSTLYEGFIYLEKLEEFYFGDNKVPDPIGLVMSLRPLTCLTVLDLRKCSMGTLLGEALAQIGKLNHLLRLDLSECNIHGFPTPLTSLTNLEYLDLSYNFFTTIPDEIGKLSSLIDLSLIGCGITYVGPGITQMENLTVLRLHCNELHSLPNDMKDMKSLRQLLLMYNNFKNIPTCIVGVLEDRKPMNSTLETLSLEGNPIDCESELSFPLKLEQLSVSFQPPANLIWPTLIVQRNSFNEHRDALDLGEIYLGCFTSAKNKHVLEHLNIKSILVIGNRLYQLYPSRFRYSQYFIDDIEGADLYSVFREGTEFIHRSRERGAVLVHCRAGVSRSASLVIAYLIRYHKMKFEDAMEKVKLARDVIEPNHSFVEQLKRYSTQNSWQGKLSNIINLQRLSESTS